ncbi:hypothetical protein LQ772_13520 [Frateuria edaphi]|uniref:hypothetical protein n=1 Tax=Frateuria edaphi TaxID=2898793 RepID=UPI001E5B945D|nr:hypothetical protein [Frateuria edaphi]UGB44999.1 hypothetical protein LQ772_13520 [Frateuria edaphi]
MNSRIRGLVCSALASLLLSGCGPSYNDGSGLQAGATVSLKIVGFGPKRIEAGVPFNTQPDGSAAAWVRLDHPVDGSHATLEFDGTALHTVAKGSLVTAVVPASFYAQAGTHTLDVVETTKEGTRISSEKVDLIAR